MNFVNVSYTKWTFFRKKRWGGGNIHPEEKTGRGGTDNKKIHKLESRKSQVTCGAKIAFFVSV